jgi:N utilization substance protein B
MASNRHLGRIIALQTLYELDFRRDAGDTEVASAEIMARNIARYSEMVDDVAFIEQLVAGVTANASDLDSRLQPVAPEWPLAMIARMDHLVLRIGLYELENEADVPAKVVINEAVELAKAFGGDNSSKFINGVLGTLLRQREADLGPLTDDKPPLAAKPVPKKKAAPKKATAKKPAAKKAVAKPTIGHSAV